MTKNKAANKEGQTLSSFDNDDDVEQLLGLEAELDPLLVNFEDDLDSDIFQSSAQPDIQTPCSYISGPAGSGKTFEILRRVEEDPEYAILSASTGIASINLNATTIHSLLGFFDLDSLRDAYIKGTAARKLRDIIDDGYRNVVLDEISMVSHQMLDTLVNIFDQVNQTLRDTQHPIGLVLVGDFAQLPPIPEGRGKNRGPSPWAFEASCWDRFESNTLQLTEIRRQADQRFLSALNFARRGQGAGTVDHFQSAGVEFHTSNDLDFDGTTILAENKHVDNFNLEAMKKVRGRDMYLPVRRWGKERGEWKNIPSPEIRIRENAYVMILANKSSGRGQFEYVNGDCGHVRGITSRGTGKMPYIQVELVRTGMIVNVNPIIRAVSYKDKPEGFLVEDRLSGDIGEPDVYYPKPHYNKTRGRYIAGQINYYPIRLAFATTVHKSQGLSLDRVQVDMRAWQFTNPGMAYISLSRCRTLEGLRIVGQPDRVAAACVADPKVSRWL